jgi:hypothetical protein
LSVQNVGTYFQFYYSLALSYSKNAILEIKETSDHKFKLREN